MDSTKIVVKRVEEERDELKKKVTALTKVINGYGETSYISKEHKMLLNEQLIFMNYYLKTLEKRLKLVFKQDSK